MKKILVTILTVAMLTSAVAAFADGGPQGGPMGGQPPKMEQGRQAPEKPSDAPEKPTGEKPADAPEEPAGLTGEKPSDAPEKPQIEFPDADRSVRDLHPAGAPFTDGKFTRQRHCSAGNRVRRSTVASDSEILSAERFIGTKRAYAVFERSFVAVSGQLPIVPERLVRD